MPSGNMFQQAQDATGYGKKDYVDKGLDSIERKLGQDPNKLRFFNEKATDKARQMFEKATGKKVPSKISN
ncbi:hypothetical protein K470DRAFT_271469 [Piedraia hortae CBS 480.64]|uniref:Uncharacterized protein n=1 Tax=Piedraia hortae CBS 480.64 TaxID=1314780 RepID=A0A6A7BWJ9_9PEZI|nr:hypothetical protein K470DRAFT_271469 [Piedraia hortae CBS 480.64]